MRIDILTSLAKKDKTFTFEEASKISDLPRGSLKKVIYRLEQRGAIEHIKRKIYDHPAGCGERKIHVK